MKPNLQTTLYRIVAAEQGRGGAHEVALGVREGDTFTHACKGEGVGIESPFLIASTSKLFITAMIFQLVAEQRLTLDDPVVWFFPGELEGLHVWKGKDRTKQITVRHLLTHSSGLPDYFEGKRRDGTSLAADLFAGKDRAYGLTEVLCWCREEMRPHFAPGAGARAFYSDTNFYLLSEIVARVGGQGLDKALAARITQPLGLTRTAFFKPGMAALPLRRGADIVDVPLALASMPGDGGGVSCLADMAVFTQAFFEGRLFPRTYLEALAPWRSIFFPLKAGTGVLRFAMPRWLPPFRPGLEFIGHSGISGAFAFYYPARGRVIVGTVNQMRDRGRPYRLMINAALA